MKSHHTYMLKTLQVKRKNANLQCKHNDREKTEDTKAIKNEIGGHLSDHRYETRHCSTQHHFP